MGRGIISFYEHCSQQNPLLLPSQTAKEEHNTQDKDLEKMVQLIPKQIVLVTLLLGCKNCLCSSMQHHQADLLDIQVRNSQSWYQEQIINAFKNMLNIIENVDH